VQAEGRLHLTPSSGCATRRRAVNWHGGWPAMSVSDSARCVCAPLRPAQPAVPVAPGGHVRGTAASTPVCLRVLEGLSACREICRRGCSHAEATVSVRCRATSSASRLSVPSLPQCPWRLAASFAARRTPTRALGRAGIVPRHVCTPGERHGPGMVSSRRCRARQLAPAEWWWRLRLPLSNTPASPAPAPDAAVMSDAGSSGSRATTSTR
jgi:hypothetical protein